MKQDSSRDIEHGRGSATEALAESRTSLSEWQTDPELKFYGRAMSSAIVVVLVGLAPLNRPMIAASIPLVIQHWFVLVRYRNTLLYGLIMAGCEVFWEFELIASLPQFTNVNGIDRVVRPIAYLMLEAHWIYWVAGITRFLLPEPPTRTINARPSLGRQRTIKHWLGLFGRRSKSEKALASPTSPRSPKTIPRP